MLHHGWSENTIICEKKSAKKDHTLYVLYISIKINRATQVV